MCTHQITAASSMRPHIMPITAPPSEPPPEHIFLPSSPSPTSHLTRRSIPPPYRRGGGARRRPGEARGRRRRPVRRRRRGLSPGALPPWAGHRGGREGRGRAALRRRRCGVHPPRGPALGIEASGLVTDFAKTGSGLGSASRVRNHIISCCFLLLRCHTAFFETRTPSVRTVGCSVGNPIEPLSIPPGAHPRRHARGAACVPRLLPPRRLRPRPGSPSPPNARPCA